MYTESEVRTGGICPVNNKLCSEKSCVDFSTCNWGKEVPSIEEGNALIAELRGALFKDEDAYGNGTIISYVIFAPGNHPNLLIKRSGRKFIKSDLLYHISMDWLQPVILHIAKMQGDPSECFMGTTLDRHQNFTAVTRMNITVSCMYAWLKVVRFIQWYNIQVSRYKK